MYSVLNTRSYYTLFYITSYTFLLVAKIVEGLRCIPKVLCYLQYLKNTKYVRIVLNHF